VPADVLATPSAGLVHEGAAVDGQRLAGDEASVGAGQEGNGARDVLRGFQAAERGVVDVQLPDLVFRGTAEGGLPTDFPVLHRGRDVAGIRATPGLTEYNPEDARVKGAAIAAARRSVVLADGSKLGRVAFATVAPLSAVDAVVTDASAARQPAGELAAAGAEVIEAKVPDAGEPQ
jgi:hypothetical protein